jgi:predicted GTPase
MLTESLRKATIRNAAPDVLVSGTPHDLARLIDVDRPIVRVRYELAENDVTIDTVAIVTLKY